VPADFDELEVTMILTVKGVSGQELLHRFNL
jgi:hypothetical protein